MLEREILQRLESTKNQIETRPIASPREWKPEIEVDLSKDRREAEIEAAQAKILQIEDRTVEECVQIPKDYTGETRVINIEAANNILPEKILKRFVKKS